jgi:hypothetical protein
LKRIALRYKIGVKLNHTTNERKKYSMSISENKDFIRRYFNIEGHTETGG